MRGILLSLFLLSFLATAEAKEELIFLISPMTSPISTLPKFHPFGDYLEKRLGKRIKSKQKETYKAVNELLKEGKAHFAHLCTGGYLMGRREFNIQPLAIPVIKGKKTYRAYIITHQKSSYRSIEDLKETVFALTDPLSLTGHLFIKAYLKQRAQKPEEYFKKIFLHRKSRKVHGARGLRFGSRGNH